MYFLQREAEGQDFSCTPASWENASITRSPRAWAQWQHKQTMLINEKKLNMTNASTASGWSRRWSTSCSRVKRCISRAIRRKIKNKNSAGARLRQLA
ncbi:Fe(2+)-trafficking protein [Escherichia coli]